MWNIYFWYIHHIGEGYFDSAPLYLFPLVYYGLCWHLPWNVTTCSENFVCWDDNELSKTLLFDQCLTRKLKLNNDLLHVLMDLQLVGYKYKAIVGPSGRPYVLGSVIATSVSNLCSISNWVGWHVASWNSNILQNFVVVSLWQSQKERVFSYFNFVQ